MNDAEKSAAPTIAPPRLAAAIVGRPNVGKSALFNRMAGRKIAIVHDQPGITRDRLVAECKPPSGETFEIIDTGGIGAEVDGDFSERVHVEAEIALTAAAVILFVVDGKSGLTPVDQTLARRLRRADKPVLLVINKIDEEMHIPREGDFARLGFKEIHGVSAAHGRGVGELASAVAAHLDAQRDPEAEPPRNGRRAYVCRTWCWWVARTWARVRSPTRCWGRSAPSSATFPAPRATRWTCRANSAARITCSSTRPASGIAASGITRRRFSA